MRVALLRQDARVIGVVPRDDAVVRQRVRMGLHFAVYPIKKARFCVSVLETPDGFVNCSEP